MKRKCLFRIFGLIFLFLQFYLQCFGLEKDTHKQLNEHIANTTINGFSLTSYLIDQVGYKKGIEEVFSDGKKTMRVWEWIRDGGRYEDEPYYTRSFNHYHDPLQPWYIAGFDKTFKSSLIWAQNQGLIGSLLGGDWDWKKARACFYKGLTATTKTERDKNLADTFRALGQIMHLVHDGVVPAHVRNDPHLYVEFLGLKIGKFHFEKWILDNFGRIQLKAAPFDKSIFDIIPEATAPIPIANIFDTNRYDGTNLSVATGSQIGITEYTNANFFSEGRIFIKYPHPALEDTNIFSIDGKNPELADAEDGKLDRRIYVKKIFGEPLDRLASFSYISFDCIKKGHYEFSPYVLDDKVYEEYASKLLPRAVGYSAGLLEYFFRGKLDFKQSGTKPNGDIEITITNSSDEPLVEGVLKLYYDNDQGERKEVTLTPSAVINIPKTGTFVTTFSSPPGFNPEKIMLLYDGQLGKEKGAVIGKYGKLPSIGLLFPIQTNYEVLETSEQTQTWETYPYTAEGETAKGHDKSIYIKRHKVSGFFDYLFQKSLTNVTREQKEELLKTVLFNCWPTSYQIVKINDIRIYGVWTYQMHFPLTGIPVTWSIESINPSLSGYPPVPKMEVVGGRVGFEWGINFTSTAINNFYAKKRDWEVLYHARRDWNFDGAGMGVPPCYFSVSNTVVVQNSIEKTNDVNLGITIGNDYDSQKKIPEVTGYIYGSKKVDFKDFDQLKCPEPYQDPNRCCSSSSTRGVKPCYNGIQKSGTLYHAADVGYRRLWIASGLFSSVVQWTRNHFLEQIRENSCSNCSWPNDICQQSYDDSVQRLDASPYNNFSFWVYKADNTVTNGIFKKLQDYRVVSNLREGSSIKNYFDKHDLKYPDQVEVEMKYGLIEEYLE